MAKQFSLSMNQLLPSACVPDTTPPSFAGVSSVVPQVNGALLAAWGAGGDASSPISYEIYVQASTAVGLFNLANIARVTRSLSAKIFELANGSYLQKGVTYFVGVRAVDAFTNRDSNLVSMSAVSAGVLTDDLAAIAAELDSTADAFAASLSPEFVAFSEDEENMAVVETDEELVAELICLD